MSTLPRKLAPFLIHFLATTGCVHGLAAAEGTRSIERGADRVTVRFSDPEDAAFARRVCEAAPEALRIAERFGPLRAPVTITIHPTHAALEAAARKPGYAWLRAWARFDSIALQSVRTWSTGEITDAELRTLLVHELTHCAMFQAIGVDAAAGRKVPIWFREGMAAVVAEERYAQADEAAPAAGRPSYRDDAPRVYAHAQRMFRALVERTGDDSIRALLAQLRTGAPFSEAFRSAIGVDVEDFDELSEGKSPLTPRLAARAR